MTRSLPVLTLTLLVTAVLALPASATDIKVSGSLTQTMQHVSRHFQRNEDPIRQPPFSVWQRLRTRVDAITSPALRATAVFDIDSIWGSNSNRWNRTDAGGGALGTDGNIVKVFAAYMDWLVPDTSLRLRMGKQAFILPYAVAGSAVLGDRGTGISFTNIFNDTSSLSGFWIRARSDEYDLNKPGTRNSWARPWDRTGSHDSADYVALALENKGEGYRVTPWLAYSRLGRLSGDVIRDVVAPAAWEKRTQADGDYTNGWYAGLTGTVDLWSPLQLAFDFNYTHLKGFDRVMDRSGWLAAGSVAYKTTLMTPKVIFWYASGDDGDISNGSERLASIAPAWTPTSFGFRNYDDKYNPNHGVYSNNIATTPAGSLGLVLELEGFRFFEDLPNLQHVFRVMYMRGTNHPDMAKYVRSVDAAPGNYTKPPMRTDYRDAYPFNTSLYMTTRDSLWEVDFDTVYKLDNNLKFMLEMGIAQLKLDKEIWAVRQGYEKTNHRIAASLVYSF